MIGSIFHKSLDRRFGPKGVILMLKKHNLGITPYIENISSRDQSLVRMGTWRVYMIFHVKIFFCSFITQKNVGVYDLQCLYFSKNFTNACKSAKSIGHFLKSAPDIVYNQLDTNFSLPRESFCESTCGIVDIVIYGSFSCQGSILFILM